MEHERDPCLQCKSRGRNERRVLPCLTSAGNVGLRQCSVHGQEGFGHIDLEGGEYILVNFLIRYRCYKKLRFSCTNIINKKLNFMLVTSLTSMKLIGARIDSGILCVFRQGRASADTSPCLELWDWTWPRCMRRKFHCLPSSFQNSMFLSSASSGLPIVPCICQPLGRGIVGSLRASPHFWLVLS